MKPYYETDDGIIYHGNVLDVVSELPDRSVHCCVTSPPYWGLRDYGVDGQLGLEKTPEEYVSKMVEIFSGVKRVLRDDGTLWLNLGDSYSSGSGGYDDKYNGGFVGREDIKGKVLKSHRPNIDLKPKNLIGIPWRVAFALQADGWYLRSDIIWHKPNPMPESVTDRPTKSHEYMFLLSKSAKYYYDADAIREKANDWGTRDRTNMRNGTIDPKLKHYGLTGNTKKVRVPAGWDTGGGSHGTIHREGRSSIEYENIEMVSRNKRSVWTIPTQPMPEAHFATFPKKLIEPCILAGCPKGGTLLDPFFGSGTTGLVAYRHNRKFIGIDLSKTYLDDIAIPRINKETQQLKLF